MHECQAYGCLNKAGEGAGKGEKVFQIPNATKFPAKRDLAIKWLHNIGTGHTVDKFNFHRKVVCEGQFTEQCFKKDVEHVLLGLPERRLLKEDAVLTECVHRQQTQDSFVAVSEQRSRKLLFTSPPVALAVVDV